MTSKRQADYLWDHEGHDPEVERLEQLLAPLAIAADATPEPMPRPRRHPRPVARLVVRAVAAGLLLAVGAWSWLQWRASWPDDAPWAVRVAQGEVRVDGRVVRATGALPVGAEIATGTDGVAALRVARIGEARLAPGSHVRLERTRSGGHRLRLLEGTLWSRVWAPPAHYGVRLRGAEAIDLGCEFLAHAARDGRGWVSVRSGWVVVDGGAHEVLVPEGARVRIDASGVPGLPHVERADAAFVAALHGLEAIDGSAAIEPALVDRLLAAARDDDAISLLSLLGRHPRLADGPLFDHLQRRWPAARVDRGAVRGGDARALEPWWQALPYPRAKRWWLHWRDALPGRPPQWQDGTVTPPG